MQKFIKKSDALTESKIGPDSQKFMSNYLKKAYAIYNWEYWVLGKNEVYAF